jgi:hypothetical protein
MEGVKDGGSDGPTGRRKLMENSRQGLRQRMKALAAKIVADQGPDPFSLTRSSRFSVAGLSARTKDGPASNGPAGGCPAVLRCEASPGRCLIPTVGGFPHTGSVRRPVWFFVWILLDRPGGREFLGRNAEVTLPSGNPTPNVLLSPAACTFVPFSFPSCLIKIERI